MLVHERRPRAPDRARRQGDCFLSLAGWASAGGIFLAARLAAAAEEPSPGDRAACVALLEGSTASVARSLVRFEATGGRGPAGIRAARELLAGATAARDRLESAAASQFCEPSRREELVYLNHLTLGFSAWLAARARRPPSEYDVASIVRRARVHRARGRERLGSGLNR